MQNRLKFRNLRGFEIFGQRIIFFLFFLILFTSGCSNILKPDKSSPALQFSITTPDKFLKINDSTTLSLKFDITEVNNFKYFWHASSGKIVGSGQKIKYIAPATPDTAMITVTARNEAGSAYTDSLSILVYKQLIMLKADDFVFDPANIVPVRWQRFIRYAFERNLKCSIGIIGNSLEEGNLAYDNFIKGIYKSGLIEFWNHGYTHLLNGTNSAGEKINEFLNTSYQEQKDHIDKTQTLAKQKLGITLHTFGAPGNSFDQNTIKALDAIDELKIWLFGDTLSSKLVLERVNDIEHPTGNPDFLKFKSHYDAVRDYLVLQFHPNHWDDSMFEQFKQAIDFLAQKRVTFITPYEFYKLLNGAKEENE